MFRDGALIDVAQDHALHHLHVTGLFDLGLVSRAAPRCASSAWETKAAFRQTSTSP